MNKKFIVFLQSLVFIIIIGAFTILDISILNLIPSSPTELKQNVETIKENSFNKIKKISVSNVVSNNTQIVSSSLIQKKENPIIETLEIDNDFELNCDINSFVRVNDIIAFNSTNNIFSKSTGRIINIYVENNKFILKIDLITNYFIIFEFATSNYSAVSTLLNNNHPTIPITIGNYTSLGSVSSCVINEKNNYEILVDNLEYNPNIFNGFAASIDAIFSSTFFLVFPKVCALKRIKEETILTKRIKEDKGKTVILETKLRINTNLFISSSEYNDYHDYYFVYDPFLNMGDYLPVHLNY